jgi:hypothetical protein
MTQATLVTFLLWSLAANYSILLLWFGAWVFAKPWLRRLHGRWFRLSDEAFDAIHYGGMALFKVGIFLLNIAPLFALWMMGSDG